MAQDRRHPILRAGEFFHFHRLDSIVNDVSDKNGGIE